MKKLNGIFGKDQKATVNSGNWFKFRHGNFLQNVGSLTASTVFSQILGLVITALAAKFFLVEEFGEFMVFNSHLAILVSIALLSYPKSLPNIHDSEVSSAVLALAGLAFVILSLVIISYITIGYRFALPLGISVFSKAWIILLEMSNLRWKRFNIMAAIRILPNSFFLILLGLGYLGKVQSLSLLIWSSTLASFLSMGVYFLVSFHRFERKSVSLKMSKAFLLREKKFPLLVAPSELCNRAAYNLPIIFIESLFPNGAALAGQYGLVLRLCFGPLGIIGTSFGKVFHADLAQKMRKSDPSFWGVYLNMRKSLALLGVVVGLVLAFIFPHFVTYFGAQYDLAGVFAQLLSPLFCLMVLVMPLSVSFYVFEKHGYLFSSQLAYLIISLISFGSGYFFENIVLSVCLFSGLSTIRYVIIFWEVHKTFRKQFRSLLTLT